MYLYAFIYQNWNSSNMENALTYVSQASGFASHITFNKSENKKELAPQIMSAGEAKIIQAQIIWG
jgi:23S rRNA A1618 N6-methylase RlmF